MTHPTFWLPTFRGLLFCFLKARSFVGSACRTYLKSSPSPKSEGRLGSFIIIEPNHISVTASIHRKLQYKNDGNIICRSAGD